ncbi:MAG: hypothetical protein LBR08_13355 [Bacteroidales bacterium]|jgi:hypothetical protein|nr:hypothetical protein [Bacteroidales bacterium]
MKKLIIFIVAMSFAAASCKQTGQTSGGASSETKAAAVETGYDVDSLLSVAESYVNKPVTIHGFVTHTCKHAGKRCFLTGESQQYSIRVEAKGDIGGFNRELVGSQLVVNGTLKERRLSQEEINHLESDVNERMGKESDPETCAAELASITKIQNWMKEHGKDYYSIYYVDGINYEVLD